MRAPNVLDNLIYRREIPVMIARVHQSRPAARPAGADAAELGRRHTNRPTEYNTLDDKYARVIVDELMPVLYKDYNISKDPERHGIGGAELRRDRRVHRRVGAAERVPQGAQHRRQLHEPPRRPRLSGERRAGREEADPRLPAATAATTIAAPPDGTYDETRDWFYQNVRLMKALRRRATT